MGREGVLVQIDCIAYSADLPYSVHVQPDVGQQKLHRVATPEASINGLTYLYQLVLAKDVRYLSIKPEAAPPKPAAWSCSAPCASLLIGPCVNPAQRQA